MLLEASSDVSDDEMTDGRGQGQSSSQLGKGGGRPSTSMSVNDGQCFAGPHCWLQGEMSACRKQRKYSRKEMKPLGELEEG